MPTAKVTVGLDLGACTSECSPKRDIVEAAFTVAKRHMAEFSVPVSGEVVLPLGAVADAVVIYVECDNDFELGIAGTQATQAMRTGTGGTFTSPNGLTLILAIDGGPNFTTTFMMSDTGVAACAARINTAAAAAGLPTIATVVAGQIRLKSPTFGAGSSVAVLMSSTGLTMLGLSPASTVQGAASVPSGPKTRYDKIGTLKPFVLATAHSGALTIGNPSASVVLNGVYAVGGN